MSRYFLLFFCLSFIFSSAQNPDKKAMAMRISTSLKIDGLLNDSVWKQAQPIADFRQYIPAWGAAVTQKTEVRILYDDNAIYVGAVMYDSSPDSILKQLGSRDEVNLNTDLFAIAFDTYNDQRDAYIFQVSASGVQSDSRVSDPTYNAVWQSAVKIIDNGWSAEFKIPYSALRFPNKDSQVWEMEILRYIRRNRETDYWALPKKGSSNPLVYFGSLNGITNIKVPMRLSFTPYLSIYAEHYPYNVKGLNNFSESFNGGMDLKYGINESFTLDMTLLPDFSQVPSDNKVKNLTAFETVYDEQRPFFNEAVDLFQLGGLFYSRRIGHTSLKHDSIENDMAANGTIIKNPDQAKLINATKVSGRNKNGLAIGFLNAVTDNTYAELEDSLGKKRKVITDPLTNYNIVVFDQSLKNGSSIYLINTNVIRDKRYDDANVTGSGLNLCDKSNTWKLSASGAVSQIYQKNDSIAGLFTNTLGYQYTTGFYKTNGNFQFGLTRDGMDNRFNANDLGVTLFNNYITDNVYVDYNIYEPFWNLLNMYNNLTYYHSVNFLTGKLSQDEIKYNHNGTFKNYFTYWFGIYGALADINDYYEPRTAGRYFIQPPYTGGEIGCSSDYRKAFAFDFESYIINVKGFANIEYGINIRPILRVSDKFNFNHRVEIYLQNNSVGYAALDSSGNIIFGNRDLFNVINTFTGEYMFKNDLSLSLHLRHYWSKGKYDKYFALSNDGHLLGDPSYITNNNFNYNAFNIDLDFNWQFAPGSSISIVYKNAILKQEKEILYNYFYDVKNTLESPQTNSISLKILYYIDYLNLRKKK
jgi:hypothetical protein